MALMRLMPAALVGRPKVLAPTVVPQLVIVTRFQDVRCLMADARFEDGGEAPLHLVAQDAEDLAVISALVQDAVFPITEMKFAGKRAAALPCCQPLPLGRPREAEAGGPPL